MKNKKDYLYDDKQTHKMSAEELSEKRKKLIEKCLPLKIMDIRTFMGYKGDYIVEFSTLDMKTSEKNRKNSRRAWV